MQVFCRKANGNAELHCCVCGQGYVVLWERHTAIERAVLRVEIKEALRRQHRATTGRDSHPASEFAVPEWGASGPGSAPAEAGRVPVWDI